MSTFNPIESDQLVDPVKEALDAWNSSTSEEGILDILLAVRRQRQEMGIEHQPTRWRLATNHVLNRALDELEQENQDQARVLRLRYLHKDTIAMTANKMNIADITVSRHQKEGIQRLAEILCYQEEEVRQQRAAEIEARLEASTYTKLFGVAQVRRQLLEQILLETQPWVVAIVGLGGIGKTSLADSVVREVMLSFRYEDVIWLRAGSSHLSGRSAAPEMTYEALITDLAEVFWPGASDSHFRQRLVQVRQKLNDRPHLVIIDNLESQSDTAYLLAHLNELANPSKFLLTTRSRPAAQAGVYSLSLDELPFSDASALMRHYGKEIGISAIDEASDLDFRSIYNVVGGNPQALKLVTSLLDLLPLSDLLNRLQRGSAGEGIEEMYKHIYLQSWQTLSQNARQLLRVMPLVAEYGGDPEYLQAISQTTDNDFWPAMQELRSRSLVEIRGGVHEKRYGIHRLTETFLRTEIVGWDETPDGT